MEQLMIYEYLQKEEDPVFKKIAALKKRETIALEGMDLSLNPFGLYEVSGEHEHECFSDKDDCYKFICQSLEDDLLSETV